MPQHTEKLNTLVSSGKLKVEIDIKFGGLEQVADAVEYLYSGKNKGKVVVDMTSSKL